MKRAGWPQFEPFTSVPPGAPNTVGLRFSGLAEAADRYASNRATTTLEGRRMERLAALVEAGERACFVASKRGYTFRPRDAIASVRARLTKAGVIIGDRMPAQRSTPRPALVKPTFRSQLSFNRDN